MARKLDITVFNEESALSKKHFLRFKAFMVFLQDFYPSFLFPWKKVSLFLTIPILVLW